MHQHGTHHEYSAHGLFILVAVFLAVYLLLTFYNPEIVQRKVHGKAINVNDQALTMIWALGITLAILFVLALIWYGFTCWH
jgi:Na+/proline symporter